MPEYNGIDPSCPFDTSEYDAGHTAAEARGRVDVRKILAEADRLYGRNDPGSAEKVLEEQLRKAEDLGDREGKLGILNELLGCYRKTGNREAGLRAAQESSALVRLSKPQITTWSGMRIPPSCRVAIRPMAITLKILFIWLRTDS